MKMPELIEMLKAGVHFGHQSSKQYPKMGGYIHTTRNRISIIDLEQTAVKLKEALDFVSEIVSQGGTVLFVSSKKQAREIIKQAGQSCQMPYINSRWLGGTFTNFGNITKLTKKLKELESKEKSGELEKYTKKEQLDFTNEITRLSELVGGIRDMSKMPEAMFVVDIKKDKSAVAEAVKKQFPIIALVDTNVNPSLIKYPVPANDDAVKSIELITNLIAEAVNEGRLRKPA